MSQVRFYGCLEIKANGETKKIPVWFPQKSNKEEDRRYFERPLYVLEQMNYWFIKNFENLCAGDVIIAGLKYDKSEATKVMELLCKGEKNGNR